MVLVVVSQVLARLVCVWVLLSIVLILSWCSTFAKHVSQSSAVKTGLIIPGLMICCVTMSTWLLVCVVSVLLLVWGTAIVVISVILLIATVVLSIVLVVIISTVII